MEIRNGPHTMSFVMEINDDVILCIPWEMRHKYCVILNQNTYVISFKLSVCEFDGSWPFIQTYQWTKCHIYTYDTWKTLNGRLTLWSNDKTYRVFTFHRRKHTQSSILDSFILGRTAWWEIVCIFFFFFFSSFSSFPFFPFLLQFSLTYFRYSTIL